MDTTDQDSNMDNADHDSNMDNIGQNQYTANMENQVVASYIDFVNNTNTSIHSIITIINNQQQSFHGLLNHYHPQYRQRARSSPYSTRYYEQGRRRSSMPRYFASDHSSSVRSPLYRIHDDEASFVNIINQLLAPENTITMPTPTLVQVISVIKCITFAQIEEPLNLSCPISHLDFAATTEVIQLQGCKHIFSNEIIKWFERSALCPMCRYDIRTYTSTGTTGTTGTTATATATTATARANTGFGTTAATARANTGFGTTSTTTTTTGTGPTSFANTLAAMISQQLTNNFDLCGNIVIEFERGP